MYKKLCWKNNLPYIAIQMPGLKAAASLLPLFTHLDFKAGESLGRLLGWGFPILAQNSDSLLLQKAGPPVQNDSWE